MTGLRTAYLVSQYPKLSHAFIEREIRALRALGATVETFSVRPTPDSELLGSADRAEAQHTTALLSSKGEVLRAVAELVRSKPFAALRGVRVALGTGPSTARARLWQLFYLAESVVLLRELDRRGLRHVHVHLANNGADIARLAVALGPHVHGGTWSWSFSMHGPTEFYDVEGFDLAAKVRSASFVACISDYCRSQLMMLVEPAHWKKLSLVRMSVELERYPLMSEDRAGRGGPLRVLFVGRMTAEKAPQVLVEALSLLPQGAAVARFIGGGDAQEALEHQVKSLSLTDSVEVLGPRGQDELPDHYGWADVFCLPSFAEGVPVVLMEAMATGLPVVTTEITGIPELVEHGTSGLLVVPGRPDLVASALQVLAGEEDLRHRMGSAGRARVEEEFTPAPNARALRTLLAAHAG